MLDAAADDEAVSGASVEGVFADRNPQVSAHDVDHLFVRMTVANADPTFTHQMFGQKQFVVTGSDATNETGFRVFCDSVLGRDEHEIGVRGVCHVLDGISEKFCQFWVESFGLRRASLTMATYRRAASVIEPTSPDSQAAAETSSPPMPKASAPARMKSAAVSRFTPPVGTIGTCGKGAFSALMYFAPPTVPHGKIFTKSLPAFQAAITSVGVSAPAMMSLPCCFAN